MPIRTHLRAALVASPLLCGGALLGCGSLSLQTTPAIAHASPADEYYQRGRTLSLARHYDEAIAAYEVALQADGAHVNARNGLAIAYAEQGDYAKAIPIWRELTRGATMNSGPTYAFLFGNLGYAHYLQGDFNDALSALEKACLLDPLNQRAWQYLGETLQKLGQDERARQMLRQASALREHDFQVDYATATGGHKLPAIEQAVQRVRQPDQEWAFTEVIDKGNGLLELRRVASASVAHKEAAKKEGEQSQPLVLAALEISNGNGRQGMARRLSRQIQEPGVKIVRLSNEKGFAVRQTRIEYQPAFRGVAERLAQRFGANIAVEVALASRADVRLVLGHDLPPQRIAVRLDNASGGHAGAVAAP